MMSKKVGPKVGPLIQRQQMANKKDYIHPIDGIKGLKADKNFKKFRYRCKIDGREYTTTIDFTGKNWTKSDRIKYARREAESFRENKASGTINLFSPHTKFDLIAEEYFAVQPATKWTDSRRRQYELYIKPHIGDKAVGRIIQNDIDRIRKKMEIAGYSKQNENGCSPRTIHKVLVQILKPILIYAHENGAIVKVPTIKVKKTKTKKYVIDGIGQLRTLYRTIMHLYADDSFYRALFLFAVQGRRWNEIRTLRWEDISFSGNFYTIRAEVNKIAEDQTYELWQPIREALMDLEERNGLVFKSPITEKELHSPRKQLARIKNLANIPDLTMHKFRHIAVTAMGERGLSGTVLSAALGHTNSTTVDKHYRTLNHLKGSRDATAALDDIVDDRTKNDRPSK